MSAKKIVDDQGHVKAKPKEEAKPLKDRPRRPEVETTAGRIDASQVTQMQQTVGNAAVQRFLAQRSGSGPTEVDEETAANINSQRGQGQTLDEGMAEQAGRTMGQDFGDVKVHTDAGADQLSEQLGARAFTTGKDIFFREGAYSPATEDGQRLIAHELTHVVQQGASTPSIQGKMTVNDPGDQFEAEADRVADSVMTQREEGVQRQEDEEEVQMQEDEEEVQMQEDEEEVQMQEDEEEVQMEAEVEEEEEAA